MGFLVGAIAGAFTSAEVVAVVGESVLAHVLGGLGAATGSSLVGRCAQEQEQSGHEAPEKPT